MPLSSVGLSYPALLIASDGVWDIWGFDEVSDKLVPPGGISADDMAARAETFCEETRATGAKYFGEAADNLTGVLIDLSEVCR